MAHNSKRPNSLIHQGVLEFPLSCSLFPSKPKKPNETERTLLPPYLLFLSLSQLFLLSSLFTDLYAFSVNRFAFFLSIGFVRSHRFLGVSSVSGQFQGFANW